MLTGIILTLLTLFFFPLNAQHHMLREICEQQAAITRTIDYCNTINAGAPNALWQQLGLNSDAVKNIPAMHMVGAGTSWHAAHLGRFFFEELCKIPAHVTLASELPYLPFFYDTNTLHVALSQSGETSDTLEALQHIHRLGQHTAAIVNVAGSTMTKQADGFLHMQAGPELAVASTKVFSNQVAILYWLAHQVAAAKGLISQETAQEANADLLQATNVLQSSLEQYNTLIATKLAPLYATYNQFFFVGRQVSYPLALEAALKLKETSYQFTQAYPAGELRHGPIALVDDKTVVTFFSVLDPAIYQKLVTNAQAVKACNGKLIVFAFQGQDELIRLADTAFVFPHVKPLLAPLAMTGLMQLLVYHITTQKGLDGDKPRNLSKAVVGDTVPNVTAPTKSSEAATLHMPTVFYPETVANTDAAATTRILVFAPHPDDEVIGCGGSIALHKQQGHHVSVAYMTSGDAGSILHSKAELAAIREQEATQGAAILGIDALYFLRNADGYLSYNRDTLISLINLIRIIRPHVVYIPHRNDGHKDHMATHELVSEAVARASGPHFQECTGTPWATNTILCYEVWTPLQEVSLAKDITTVMASKMEALQKHVSQIQNYRYDDAVFGLNRYRGTMTGAGTYAECFSVSKL